MRAWGERWWRKIGARDGGASEGSGVACERLAPNEMHAPNKMHAPNEGMLQMKCMLRMTRVKGVLRMKGTARMLRMKGASFAEWV